MRVQRVVMPETEFESWTVLGDDQLPVEPVERFLAYLASIEKSPNTIKAYAHDLKDWFTYLAARRRDWRTATPEDVAGFVAWLRLPPKVRDGKVVVLPTVEHHCGTVNLRSCGHSANRISLIRHTRPGESRRRTGENRPRTAQVDSAIIRLILATVFLAAVITSSLITRSRWIALPAPGGSRSRNPSLRSSGSCPPPNPMWCTWRTDSRSWHCRSCSDRPDRRPAVETAGRICGRRAHRRSPVVDQQQPHCGAPMAFRCLGQAHHAAGPVPR